MARKWTLALYGLVFAAVFTAVWLGLTLALPHYGEGWAVEGVTPPPTVCAAGVCVYATATPRPTWGAATAEAWATYETGRHIGWAVETAEAQNVAGGQP